MKKIIFILSIAALSCGDGNTADEERGERSTYEMANTGTAASEDTTPGSQDTSGSANPGSSTIDSSRLSR